MNTHETALKSNPTQRGQNEEYTSGPAEVNELITKKSRVRKVWQRNRNQQTEKPLNVPSNKLKILISKYNTEGFS